MDLKNRRFGSLTAIRPSDKKRYWICSCSCGNRKEIRDNHLTMKKIITCGECPIFELPGKKIGKLTVKQYIPEIGKRNVPRKFLCICECGNEIVTHSSLLICKRVLSCGKCVDRTSLIGKKFGYFRVIEYSYDKGYPNTTTYWKCQCNCGNIKIVSRCNLVTGGVQSCGCKKFVEGSMQGERGNVNTLKEEDVIQIRKFYAQELIDRKSTGERFVNHSLNTLSERYRVSTTTIFKVIHSRTWFFLPPIEKYIQEIKTPTRH